MPQLNTAPRTHALRIGRFTEPGRPYLLTTTTAGREPIFNDLYAARIVVRSLRHLDGLKRVESLAYVVMPDHLHWLCIPRSPHSLAKLMHTVKSWTALVIARECGIEGAIWQRGFHDRALRSEEAIKDVARYIVANPIRAGLVRSVREYPHWDAVWL